jgi:hypothetical protein
MLKFQEYQEVEYAALPTFAEARSSYPQWRGKLLRLGGVICRHGLQTEIGLTMLHRHFPLDQGMRLVRRVGGNEAFSQPTALAETPGAVPYLWKMRMNDDTGGVEAYPLEFVEPTECPRAAAIVAELASRPQFLHEIAETIAELELQNVIGVSTLHCRFNLRPDEMVLETTDEIARVLRLSVQPRCAVDSEAAFETNWQFLPSGLEDHPHSLPRMVCINHCNDDGLH